jgi:hypothetical protein
MNKCNVWNNGIGEKCENSFVIAAGFQREFF